MFRCEQPGCEERFDDQNEFTVHRSYHDYHQKIKEAGLKELEILEKRFNTQLKCPLADSLEGFYYFPQLPLTLICGWYECRQQFLSVEEFYNHVSHHAHRFVDKCYWENCNKTLKKITLQLLREHLRVHTLQKLYACPYCGNFFSTRIKFDDHFLRHKDKSEIVPVDGNKINIYKCSFENCDKSFLTSSLLREHIRIHSDKNKCPHCPFVAKTNSTLDSHILYRHQTVRNYECSICQKTFKQRGDLRAHVRRHQILEPYKCDKCDFETLNEEGLATHVKLHDRNHDYCCHICQKVFSRGNNLTRHLKIQHKLALPDGQSRFKYRLIDEGVYLLDTGE